MMELTQVLKFLIDTPFALVMLYLLVKEQTAHSETRAKCMELSERMTEKYVDLQRETMQAIDRLTPNK